MLCIYIIASHFKRLRALKISMYVYTASDSEPHSLGPQIGASWTHAKNSCVDGALNRPRPKVIEPKLQPELYHLYCYFSCASTSPTTTSQRLCAGRFMLRCRIDIPILMLMEVEGLSISQDRALLLL